MASKWDNKERKLAYATLLMKFYDKHNFIAKYHIRKAKERGDSVMWPQMKETKEFQARLKLFFVNDFGELPGSFNLFASVSYGIPTFDPYPVEKLKKLYEKIELELPEPFESDVYIELEVSKKEILAYTGYPIFARK